MAGEGGRSKRSASAERGIIDSSTLCQSFLGWTMLPVDTMQDARPSNMGDWVPAGYTADRMVGGI